MKTEDDWGYFQCMSTEALLAIATNKVDATKIAREQLEGRGVGCNGSWVGFKQAEEEWKNFN